MKYKGMKYRLQWILDGKWKNIKGTVCKNEEDAKKLKWFFQKRYPNVKFRIVPKQ